MIPHLALALLLSFAAAACSSRPLPVASGPVRQLNVGKWTATTNELTEPPSVTRGG